MQHYKLIKIIERSRMINPVSSNSVARKLGIARFSVSRLFKGDMPKSYNIITEVLKEIGIELIPSLKRKSIWIKTSDIIPGNNKNLHNLRYEDIRDGAYSEEEWNAADFIAVNLTTSDDGKYAVIRDREKLIKMTH